MVADAYDRDVSLVGRIDADHAEQRISTLYLSAILGIHPSKHCPGSEARAHTTSTARHFGLRVPRARYSAMITSPSSSAQNITTLNA